MKKWSIDSDDMEAFNRYDERLLEDLALYCGLALQYVKAVLITEERRASIEVTQEVGNPVIILASYLACSQVNFLGCLQLYLIFSSQVLAYHITAAEQEIQALQVILSFL